jgi:hypothetical protein
MDDESTMDIIHGRHIHGRDWAEWRRRMYRISVFSNQAGLNNGAGFLEFLCFQFK